MCIFLTFLPAEVFADDWHWQKTNAAYLGPTEDEATAGAVTVKANHGQNDRDTVKKYFTKGGVNPDPSVEMKEVRRNSAAMDSKDDTSSKYGSAVMFDIEGNLLYDDAYIKR